MPDVPGQNCDDYREDEARRQLEPQAGDWQPSGGDWLAEGWDSAQPDGAEPEAPPPPPPPPALPLPLPESAPPADDDSDAYELDQERMLEEQRRVSAIDGVCLPSMVHRKRLTSRQRMNSCMSARAGGSTTMVMAASCPV